MGKNMAWRISSAASLTKSDPLLAIICSVMDAGGEKSAAANDRCYKNLARRVVAMVADRGPD
jgi:hypothetical protein